MNSGHLEVLVEPFRENDPGPHVDAVVDRLQAAGLTVEMGPFATSVDGDLDAIIAAVTETLSAAFAAGATTAQLRIERT